MLQIWRGFYRRGNVLFRHNCHIGNDDGSFSLIFGLVCTHWHLLMHHIHQRVHFCTLRECISCENITRARVNKWQLIAFIDCIYFASTVSSVLTVGWLKIIPICRRFTQRCACAKLFRGNFVSENFQICCNSDHKGNTQNNTCISWNKGTQQAS